MFYVVRRQDYIQTKWRIVGNLDSFVSAKNKWMNLSHEPFHPTVIIGDHRHHLGLLEHDFGHPDLTDSLNSFPKGQDTE